jgi:hypothetical protein
VTGTGPAPVAAFGPDGSLVALLTEDGGRARSLAVFAAEPASAGPVVASAGSDSARSDSAGSDSAGIDGPAGGS